MKVVLDFDRTGLPLEDFLKNNEAAIKNKRGLYVLSFNLDKKRPNAPSNVVKIGIARRHVGLRLKSYINHFGRHSHKYPCRGVWIHYLATTQLNRNVEDKNTAVYRMERYLIKYFKNKTVKTDRGHEWFVTGIRIVEKAIKSNTMSDIITKNKYISSYRPSTRQQMVQEED